MKYVTLAMPLALAVLSASALLSGCSTDPKQQGQASATESSYTTVGSYIPRKKSAGQGADNVVNANLQNLENDRNNGNGVINLPTR